MARSGSLSRRIERLLNDVSFRQAFAGIAARVGSRAGGAGGAVCSHGAGTCSGRWDNRRRPRLLRRLPLLHRLRVLLRCLRAPAAASFGSKRAAAPVAPAAPYRHPSIRGSQRLQRSRLLQLRRRWRPPVCTAPAVSARVFTISACCAAGGVLIASTALPPPPRGNADAARAEGSGTRPGQRIADPRFLRELRRWRSLRRKQAYGVGRGYGVGQSTTTESGSSNYSENGKHSGYHYSYSSNGESYAVIRGDTKHMTFSGDWIEGRREEIDKARKQAHGDFLWFTRDGKSYFVDDPSDPGADRGDVQADGGTGQAAGRTRQDSRKSWANSRKSWASSRRRPACRLPT